MAAMRDMKLGCPPCCPASIRASCSAGSNGGGSGTLVPPAPLLPLPPLSALGTSEGRSAVAVIDARAAIMPSRLRDPNLLVCLGRDAEGPVFRSREGGTWEVEGEALAVEAMSCGGLAKPKPCSNRMKRAG